jgi:hypothetical protein
MDQSRETVAVFLRDRPGKSTETTNFPTLSAVLLQDQNRY